MKISNIYMAPIWVVQIFTQTKSFQSNPILGSCTLNELGLHVFRTSAAHCFARFRRFLISPLVNRDYREEYRQNGFIKIENFLPQGEFQALKAEVLNIDGEMREMAQGNTLTQMVALDDDRCTNLPNCKSFRDNRLVIRLTSYVSSCFSIPLCFIHCVKNGYVESAEADPQKALHSDTFHPTAKYWLFLDDVEMSTGPFVYAKGSHRLTKDRLKWEYKRSCKGAKGLEGHSLVGSLRIHSDELERLGFQETALPVSKNTLVIADTHGFHRRGNTSQPCSRLAIYGYSRTSPFNPLPGFGAHWFMKVQYFVLKKMWERADRAAEQKNTKPAYQKVSTSRLKMIP